MRFLRSSWYGGVAVLLMALPSAAQESGAVPADSSTGWIFRWVNFAIVLVLLIWGFRKLGPYFRSHADEISRSIAEGARARAAAEQQRRDAEARLKNLDQEIVQLRAEAKKDADAEAQRLREMAREEVHKIDLAAQAEIAASERAAQLDLKLATARMAIERAGMLLKDEITPQVESSLLQAFVADLNGSGN